MKLLLSFLFIICFNVNLLGQSSTFLHNSTILENNLIIKPKTPFPSIQLMKTENGTSSIRFINQFNNQEAELSVSSNSLRIIAASSLFFENGSPSVSTMTVSSLNRVGIGTSWPTSKLEINGFTKLGSDAPAIKIKKYEGTTSNTQGAFVEIVTDINPLKVIAVNLMVEYNPGSYIPQIYDLNPNYDYNWFASPNSSGFFTITLRTKLGNSSLILSKPIKVLVTYEE